MSDSSRSALYYVKETNWGATPALALKQLRFTSESLGQTTEVKQSEEIRSDRQVADVIRTSIKAEGEVSAELSFGALEDLLEGALMGAWAADPSGDINDQVLTNGTTPVSFTFEKQFQDVNEFVSFPGMRVNTLSLNLATGDLVKASMSLLGKKAVAAGATVGTGAAVAAPTADVMNMIDHLTAMNEGGGAFTDVLNLELQIANNLREQGALGVLGARGIGLGDCVVTGRIRQYFLSRTWYQKYLNFTASSADFTLTDAASGLYTFTLPKLKYTGGRVVAEGKNGDVVADMTFQAYRDPTSGNTIKIYRNPNG